MKWSKVCYYAGEITDAISTGCGVLIFLAVTGVCVVGSLWVCNEMLVSLGVIV